jgi:Pyruvate/2-oxoacid:ferredoxin oxidoreductase delta subunit
LRLCCWFVSTAAPDALDGRLTGKKTAIGSLADCRFFCLLGSDDMPAAKPFASAKRQQQSRREFLRTSVLAVAEHPYDLELCDLCVRQCPIEIRITQCAADALISDGCVGCGVCEMICPPEPPAIVIDIDKITEWV